MTVHELVYDWMDNVSNRILVVDAKGGHQWYEGIADGICDRPMVGAKKVKHFSVMGNGVLCISVW